MILHENVKFGDVVYCGESQQVYMVEGWNYKQDKLCLKNLTNLEAEDTYISPFLLSDLPDNWATKDYYELLAKKIVDNRKRI